MLFRSVSMPPSFNLEHRHLSVMLQAVLNSDPSVRLAANDSRVKTVQMIWNKVLACTRTGVAKQARTAVQKELVALLVAQYPSFFRDLQPVLKQGVGVPVAL